MNNPVEAFSCQGRQQRREAPAKKIQTNEEIYHVHGLEDTTLLLSPESVLVFYCGSNDMPQI